VDSMNVDQKYDFTPGRWYARLAMRGGKSVRPVRMELPIVIGSGGQADVIINAAGLDPLAKILCVRDEKLALVSLVTGVEIPVSGLQRLGLNVAGPWLCSKTKNAALRGMSEAIQTVEAWQQDLPQALRLVSGANLARPLRRLALVGWAFGLFGMAAWAVTPGAPETRDLSQVPRELVHGVIRAGGIGAVADEREHEKGFMLAMELPASEQGQEQSLSFEAKGLDHDGELKVLVNGTEVLGTRADRSCLASWCAQEVIVSGMSSGKNEIRFVHTVPESDYVVRSVLVARVSQLTDVESMAAVKGFERAQRAYDERGISHSNLVSARAEIQRVRELLRTRKGAGDLRPRVEVLAADIEAAARQLKEEITFKARKEVQLGRWREAKSLYETLLVFHTDVKSREQMEIRAEIAAIEEHIK